MSEKRDLLLDISFPPLSSLQFVPPTACITLDPCTDQHTLGCFGPFSLNIFVF